MKETLSLFKNVIRHPGKTVTELNEKSWALYLVLFIINAPLGGWLFLYTKLIIPVDSGLFLVGGPIAGTFQWVYLGLFQGLYLLISKFLFKEETKIKVLSYYFLIALTLYHILALLVAVILMPLHQYGLMSNFYIISHIVLVFWIAFLCAQALQQLRPDTELRTMLKVFPALFVSYALQTAVLFMGVGQLILVIAYP